MELTVLLGLALVLSACGAGPSTFSGGETSTTTPPGQESPTASTAATSTLLGRPTDLAELEEAKSRWAAAATSTFSYVFEDDCGECMPVSQRVVVWDGEAASGGEAVPSVDDMFDAIETAIDAGLPVDVVYDESLGFPTDIWIDREARAYDGGTHWMIQGFAGRLPGESASPASLDSAEARWRRLRPLRYEFRTTIICDCELDGWLWTQVEGDQIIDWEVELTSQASPSLSPITVDEMLDDLRELLTDAVEQDGVRIGGSAEYDPELGYPTWIGLDIEVLDPAGELGYLPPRLVFSIDQFNAIEPDDDLGFGSDLDALHEAQERWAAGGLIDYQYSLTVHDVIDATFTDPYTVIVSGSEVVAVTRDGEPIEDPDLPAVPIATLFELIQLWTQSGTPVVVIYDEALGYPSVVVRNSEDAPRIISISELTER